MDILSTAIFAVKFTAIGCATAVIIIGLILASILVIHKLGSFVGKHT